MNAIFDFIICSTLAFAFIGSVETLISDRFRPYVKLVSGLFVLLLLAKPVIESARDLMSDIEIYDSEGAKKYTIPAPVVYDSEWNTAPREDAYFTLEQSGNKKYTLTVTVNSAWMNAEDRAFPVTVDPTVSQLSSYVIDTVTSSSNPNSSYGSTIDLGVSSYQTLYWKVSTLPYIPSSAYITNSMLGYHCLAERAAPVLGAHRVTSAWDGTTTYNDYLSGEGV